MNMALYKKSYHHHHRRRRRRRHHHHNHHHNNIYNNNNYYYYYYYYDYYYYYYYSVRLTSVIELTEFEKFQFGYVRLPNQWNNNPTDWVRLILVRFKRAMSRCTNNRALF